MEREFTSAQAATLQKQEITAAGPGTILPDFEALLDFVGVRGIESGGKNCRIPLASLAALDERMTHPLRPNLTRPQQLSYPHLNGLYLLFRNTGLGVTSGAGNRARLSVQTHRLGRWQTLNAEERYFTLFATLVSADWSVIESDGYSRSGQWYELKQIFDYSVKRTVSPKAGGMPAAEAFFSWKNQAEAALLELFGILDISRAKPRERENWRITNIRATEFGSALMSRIREVMWDRRLTNDPAIDSEESPWLGAQLRDYFPDCLHTFPQDELPFVSGAWQFKVCWGDIWRRIVVPADESTDTLIGGILQAFRFDSDHLYDLRLRDRSGRNMRIGHPQINDVEYYTDEFAVGCLPLEPGQKMTFLFDFGDNWEFDVWLEKILPDSAAKKLKIIERKGKSPKQYNNDWW